MRVWRIKGSRDVGYLVAQTLHLATTTTSYGFDRSPWQLGGSGVLGLGMWYLVAQSVYLATSPGRPRAWDLCPDN